MVSAIIHNNPGPVIAVNSRSKAEALELKHYRFKNSIWNKILHSREFENFDEFEYFRLLEIYKDSTAPVDLMAIAPNSIEQKLALIESIQIKFSHFQNTPSVQNEIEQLNAYKLKKLQKLMKKFDLNSRLTRNSLEDFSSEFFLLLKGPPLSLLDYFTKNKSARMNERMFRVLQEDILIRGLKGTLERIPERVDYTRLEKAKLYVKKVMKYKVWRYMVLPYDLPWVDRVKISDQLLEKILLNGLNAHQSELIIELKRLNMIDHYERFRKVYRPVAFGVAFYYYYQKYQEEIALEEEKNNEELKKKFIEDFEKLSAAISEGDNGAKSEKELLEIQYQRVLKNYKERYQSDPTPEEIEELRLKIFGSAS